MRQALRFVDYINLSEDVETDPRLFCYYVGRNISSSRRCSEPLRVLFPWPQTATSEVASRAYTG